MEQFMKINTAVNGFVWGPVMLALLVGTGIYLSIAVGFIQFTKIGYWWKNTIGKIFKKGEAGDGEITPLQAVSTALASTVGTGNIAGVTGAIIESVTGQDVSSFMREYLFAPLGIDAAYTATQLEEAETYLTATYHKDGSLYRAPSYLLRQAYDAFATPDTHYRVTVGSLLIRPRDLTRLGIALCGDGTVDGVRVLSEKAIAMMRQEQSMETKGITSDTPYSFFTIRKDSLLEGRRVYGHQGTDEGIVCNLYVEPVSQTVFCVMTNGCKTTREDGIMRITRRLCAAAAEVFLPEAN